MPLAAQVSVGLFMAGVIFALGHYAARVQSLEKWRDEVTRSFDQVHNELRHIAGLITGDETR